MKISEALEGYFFDLQARGYSDQTIHLYRMYLPMLVKYLQDPEIENVTSGDLNRFMVFLRVEYKPRRLNGDQSPLSPSAIDNHWKVIRSFFKWCNESFEINRPDLKMLRPKFKLPQVTAFTEEEIKKIMDGCTFNREPTSTDGKLRRKKRPTADRDRALILLLLDTGLRVGEICRLTIECVNLQTGEILVEPHGRGQKTKPRTVYLGTNSRRAMWMYIAKRKSYHPNDKLFEMNEKAIRAFLWRMGEKVGVKNVHPHKFRHTFAIWYLRNGGDVFTLARMLGHSTLEMTMHYLDLVKTDVENAHKRASPADRWNL